ncbi:unnamed protein product [Angiostrongylus costaricensis]|uniref:RAB6-interacting golgin n=1 Tax=Angiostrongylus costaricensis TaxID=334426 RepID=A0A0R3PKC8_ANGCS|nr:unnamed protein product [Angiostrongylus costaricensis]
MESRSKFACLYIGDDSDEEFTVVGGSKCSSKTNNSCRSKSMGIKQPKSGGQLIVHAVQKRPKAKKANREKVVDGATGLIVQGADDHYLAEQKYREGDQNTPPVGKILRPTGDESQKQNSPSFKFEENTDSEVIQFYKKKLAEALDQAATAKQETQSVQAELERYRTRYRKLVELFRDAELTEKAKLIIELDKTRTSEAELSSQLVVTQKELEQCKSKLRALGALVSRWWSTVI